MQETLGETHRLLINTAKREHARVMETDPRPSNFRRIVDGRSGEAEEAVKPAGIIVYQYPRIEQVVQFAMETLFDRSPVDSGDYRNAHMIFIENSPARNLEELRPSDQVTITNPLPYARKIEVGAMTMRVPGTDQVYQQARQIVASRWGNVAKIKFTFRAIIGGHVAIQERAAARGRYVGRPATGDFERQLAPALHNRADLRFPALVISEL
ncbi:MULTISPECIES: hypothetical protein [Phyllobacteriaceae]|nr:MULTISPECIES: hypothetical protein [Mesorhizobium]MBN9235098.1 hypothetical protein [Mesorhizobium sp.]